MNHYGYGTVTGYTAATLGPPAAPGTVTTINSATYYWSTPRRHVFIHNHPNSPANLYARINAPSGLLTSTVSTTDWDFVLQPGESWSGFQDSNLMITGFSVYVDAAAVYGTDFVVKGVD
jgi:hypothetical protein